MTYFRGVAPYRHWFPRESIFQMTRWQRARTSLIWMATLIALAILMCFVAMFTTMGRMLYAHRTVAGSALLLLLVNFAFTLRTPIAGVLSLFKARKSVVDTVRPLGVVPNLPDRFSDPQQAAIAAHCIHQIRALLQISNPSLEPKAYCITSPSSGDGKTSLTLALGLSFAACGARTLMIDCDLVEAGLTHRLNLNSPNGVLEAVANRSLLDYVHTTDIADVYILPVGTTHAHHASTLSPTSMRRLIAEGKKHFDLVLVDTAPILGSIEASLVCVAVDYVVLTADTKQRRKLVEKSIDHLYLIGAKIGGIVVNRVKARDFEHSMHGLRKAFDSSHGSKDTSRAHDNKTIGASVNSTRLHP